MGYRINDPMAQGGIQPLTGPEAFGSEMPDLYGGGFQPTTVGEMVTGRIGGEIGGGTSGIGGIGGIGGGPVTGAAGSGHGPVGGLNLPAGWQPPKMKTEGGLAREEFGEWYHSGLTPEGMLAEELVYDPTLIDPYALDQAQAMDFDPIRQQAMGQLGAQQASGYQTALTQQAAAGGLTAADRMALASSFNRGRMGATAGLLGELGVAEARNIWETDEANRQMMNQARLQNIELQNLAQQANIGALGTQRDKEYQMSRDLYEQQERIKQAKKLGETF